MYNRRFLVVPLGGERYAGETGSRQEKEEAEQQEGCRRILAEKDRESLGRVRAQEGCEAVIQEGDHQEDGFCGAQKDGEAGRRVEQEKDFEEEDSRQGLGANQGLIREEVCIEEENTPFEKGSSG
jgi:hypothetical protein